MPDSLFERVQAVLAEVRPSLTLDGGGVELVSVDGDTVRLQLTGACIGCPASEITLKYGLESAITDAIPEIHHVVAVSDAPGG